MWNYFTLKSKLDDKIAQKSERKKYKYTIVRFLYYTLNIILLFEGRLLQLIYALKQPLK